MNGRGGDAPPPNGGEFLLQLLHRPSHSTAPIISPPQPLSQNFSQDPAVAAVGPSIPTFPLFASSRDGDFSFPSLGHLPSPLLPPQNYFHQNPNLNPNLNPSFSSPIQAYYNLPQFDSQPKSTGGNSAVSSGHNLMFGSLNRDVLNNGSHILYQNRKNEHNFPSSSFMVKENVRGNLTAFGENNSTSSSLEVKENVRGNPAAFGVHKQEGSGNSNDRKKQGNSGSHRAVAPPPGFLSNSKNVRQMEHEYERSTSILNGDKGKGSASHMFNSNRSSNRLDLPGLPADVSLHSASTLDIEESMKNLRVDHIMNNDVSKTDDSEDQVEDESGEKSDKKKHHHDKDYRSDKRGKWIMSQRMRILKWQTPCRNDINMFNASLLALFDSLIPSDEEKVKQKQLITLLEKLVCKEWPDARLHLYGSCANSFGFSKSDIDVCLQMDLGGNEKSEVLLKLANIFETDNLQNVQALTRARVPIVKLMDPVTGISCDICVNNLLAVVNTKLLRDYALIDVRLRQLAFIVKHWAKSRGVNATYQGTLSSYAYVLMCIHFLQQRRPPILPCLQKLRSTYFETVDGIECAYFDQVEKLHNGWGPWGKNGESVAQLVWGFFHYWAYSHNYANDVISVRTGSTLSKIGKDWTRRVGNDRHLICIEDPFEISHDLGRVVDKFSIRVLREEFERAAEIMQYDPNPCVTLFEPYIPN